MRLQYEVKSRIWEARPKAQKSARLVAIPHSPCTHLSRLRVQPRQVDEFGSFLRGRSDQILHAYLFPAVRIVSEENAERYTLPSPCPHAVSSLLSLCADGQPDGRASNKGPSRRIPRSPTFKYKVVKYKMYLEDRLPREFVSKATELTADEFHVSHQQVACCLVSVRFFCTDARYSCNR